MFGFRCRRCSCCGGKPSRYGIDDVFNQLVALTNKVNLIMADQIEALNRLNALNEKIIKIGTEIDGLQTAINNLNTEVAALRAALEAAGGTSPEVAEALARVEAAAAAVDEKVPDAPAPEPVPEA